MDILCNDGVNAGKELMAQFSEAASLCVEREGLNPENIEISLSFVNREEIRELNRMYRYTDRSTDVLSFPMIEDFSEAGEDEYILLGDVVICLEQARAQAEEFGHSEEREIVYLFVHSVFHLLGYDHMVEDDKKEMRAAEESVMKKMGLERDI